MLIEVVTLRSGIQLLLHSFMVVAPVGDSAINSTHQQRYKHEGLTLRVIHTLCTCAGKASVYTATAGVKPSQVIPITLDVGCNSGAFRDDPLYVGLPQPRIDTAAYDELVDELVAALRARWGPSLVLHWEDLDSKNSYRLLAKYRAKVQRSAL